MTAVSEKPAAALPRDPVARLTALFDAGTMSLLGAVPADGSGAVAASGLIDGSGAVAFASDPRVQGGAMGGEGCAVIVSAYDEAITRGVPVIAANTVPTPCSEATPSASRAPPECHSPMTGTPRAMASS